MYSGEIVIIKKKLFFKYVVAEDIQTALNNIKRNEKVTTQAPCFIVVTDNALTKCRFGYIDPMELELEQMVEQGVYLKMGQNQICLNVRSKKYHMLMAMPFQKKMKQALSNLTTIFLE